jgi:hypothetical protein
LGQGADAAAHLLRGALVACPGTAAFAVVVTACAVPLGPPAFAAALVVLCAANVAAIRLAGRSG